MQVLLDSNDTLMYSTHNEYKSVITERFIKTLKAKIYKTWQLMITNLILFIWINQYNNTYHHSINRKPINTDYSALTEKVETNPKAPKFKVNDKFRIAKYKNIFSKGNTKNWSREILIIDYVLKINLCLIKLKI